MDYDVILIHAPAIFDFRNKAIFPGALGSTVEHVQLAKVPIGMLGIADYLDRNGCKVIVDNLADRMIDDREMDIEEHIKNTSAKVYGIDLHWHHHSQGAMEVAKLCKRLHPDSYVVLGGLTSTYFHEEIIRKYDFIDAVIRGEGEKAFLEFVRDIEKHGRITGTPNLTYRKDNGDICVMPLMKASTSLDEFNFLRFDLLEPQTSVFNAGIMPRWSIAVCRGCVYNCVTCGGSSYAYRKYFGMEKPSFRSPGKIIEDIKKLNENGIYRIGLYQDPRMGGEKYWRELLTALTKEDFKADMLSMDLLAPADEEYIKEIANIGKPIVLYLCPEAGSCAVRQAQGRHYSNEEILDTVNLCNKYHIPVTTFFSVGLAGETEQTMRETYDLWDKICLQERNRGHFGKTKRFDSVGGPIIGPIILEPGSMAYDNPEKYGYKLSFKNLEEYIEALSKPSWHQWLNHETATWDKNALMRYIFESIEYSISQRRKYDYYDNFQTSIEYQKLKMNMIAVGVVNGIIELEDEEDVKARLVAFKDAIDSINNTPNDTKDTYGYQSMLGQIFREKIAPVSS